MFHNYLNVHYLNVHYLNVHYLNVHYLNVHYLSVQKKKNTPLLPPACIFLWLPVFILFLFFCTACSVKQSQPLSESQVTKTQTTEIVETTPDISSEDPVLSPLKQLEKLEQQAADYAASGNYRAALNGYNFLLSKYSVDKRGSVLKKIEPILSGMKSSDLELVLKSDINRVPESMILYKLGLNHAGEGNYPEARDILTEFVSKYPGHPDAQDAGDILNLLRNKSFLKNKIGCLLPLTGKFAPFGQKALKGIQMALRDLMPLYKEKITLIIKDTKSNDKQAVRCVQELAKANVAAIAGSMVTAASAAAEAQDQNIPMICMTQKSGVTSMGDYIFSNFLTPEMQVNALLHYSYHTLGVRRFAVLYPDDKYGTTYMTLFTQIAEEIGGEVEISKAYSQDQNDFGAAVLKVVRFIKSPSSDPSIIKKAVFIPDSSFKLAMILPQFAYHNMNDIYFLGTNIWHNDYLLKEAAAYVNNSVITEGFFARSQKAEASRFAESFHLIYGETPGFIEAIAYDTVSILIRTAMEPEIQSRQSLKNALAGNRIYEGVTGKTMFEVNGKAHKELFFLTVQDSQFVEIAH